MIELTTVFGLLALIFIVSAIASGLVARAPISFPIIFLGLGFLFGQYGFGLIHISLHDPILDTIATLNLAFVFFLDALNLRFDILQKSWKVPFLSLGPGTLITMVLIAAAAALVFHLSIVPALLVGTVLSSVDPVLLRDVVQDERVPHSIRESLRTEAGANDIVVLPVLLILIAVALGQASSPANWLIFLAKLFILGPAAGAAVGALTALFMEWVRSKTPISRQYRALYGIGVLLAAYYIGTLLGSSGFISVFAAGLATALMDVDLCDCFLEYGEITSEMMMLLAFLLFGVVLSSILGSVAFLPALVFTLLVLFVARPIAISTVLRHAHISRRARLFIGWFGPRGLSSLLFGLLLVSDGVPGADGIMAIVGVVVVISVVLHGVSAKPLGERYGKAVSRQTLPEERESVMSGLYAPKPVDIPRIMPKELAELLDGPDPPLVLDVRSRSTYDREPGQIPGSIRVLPDFVAEWAEGKPKDRDIVTYCT